MSFKESPILFSGEMVRAILEGRKTVTRRVVKRHSMTFRVPGMPFGQSWPGNGFWDGKQYEPDLKEAAKLCSYGQPGDRLWVRETWADVHPLQVSEGRYFKPGRAGIPGPPPVGYRVIYRADGEYPRIHFQQGEPKFPYREVCPPDCTREHRHPAERWNGWEPSIHMPRWASRITLEVTCVRVERVQEITGTDCLQEGVIESAGYYGIKPEDAQREAFKNIWDDINAKRGFGWDKNPWIWVIEFKKVGPQGGKDE